jgi:hypothetical protein
VGYCPTPKVSVDFIENTCISTTMKRTNSEEEGDIGRKGAGGRPVTSLVHGHFDEIEESGVKYHVCKHSALIQGIA